MGEPVVERMRRAGRDLYLAGLVSTRGGNLSVRIGDVIVITRTGALLGRLGTDDFVEVPVDGESEADRDASFDLVVHREVYRRTPARAVVHTHGRKAIVLSFERGPIAPIDHEGRLFVPSVPVFDETTPRSELAGRVAGAVADGTRVVAVRGHGTFSAGDAVEAAAHWATCLEISSSVLLDARSAGINP